MQVSVILLAGGKGIRMGHPLPKQFLTLQQRPIVLHSLEVFLQVSTVKEIIVVCDPAYHHLFAGLPVQFAPAGVLRQDSVFSGLQMVSSSAQWVCTHDAARPFITKHMVTTLFESSKKESAASFGLPVKNTLKEINALQTVTRTLDRSSIWEIQTPQILKKNIMKKGFEFLHSRKLTVTDDVSLAELIGYPVKLVPGSYKNIKITTPEDLTFAEWIIQKNTACTLPMTEPATAAGKSSQIASPFKAKLKML